MASTDIVGWFADIGLHDRPHVGGKGGSLGELQRAGIQVPPGFVVKTAAFDRFLEALEKESPVRSLIEALNPDDLDAATVCCKGIRKRLEAAEFPNEVLDELSAAYSALCTTSSPVAVRSSATTEDASDASFAGLQDTYLWVTNVRDTLSKVRSCWASLYSVESVTYRRRRGFPESAVAMAVVVQKMVNARTAGVMFTRSPVTGDRSVMTIEGSWGLGSAVVGGEVTPDRWVLGKITGDISVREVSDKLTQHVPVSGGGTEALPVPDDLRRTPSLSDEELQALRAVGRKIERHYGRAQDIEWAVERDTNEIYLLQSRPETVWSAKEAQSVARPEGNPLAHVMSIFGGQR
ncbi:MAG TPA: PEP/pyruvate-binding domain-containing protein [Steroidobacteraceae bacterium]